jgi:hypothetical protein
MKRFVLVSRLYLLMTGGLVGAAAISPANAENSLFLEIATPSVLTSELNTILEERRRTPGFLNVKIVRNRDANDLRNTLRKATIAINRSAAERADDQLTIHLFEGRTIRVLGRAQSRDLELVCTPFDRTGSLVALSTEAKKFSG